MKVHLLSGFLGSGKTTVIRLACSNLLAQDITPGVITNDQGIKLVDGQFFRKMGVPERQVGNGCFCCNYKDLDNSLQSLAEMEKPQVIFAESVGTCTDIVATVFKPLLKFHAGMTITVTTVVDCRLLDMLILGTGEIFEDEVKYIFFKQLEEADIILVNKVDLADEVQLIRIREYLAENYPGKKIIEQSSLRTNISSPWLEYVQHSPSDPNLVSLELDYDCYAAGEAKMGYLDQHLHIQSDSGKAVEAAQHLISSFVESVQKSGAAIGHVKFWVNDSHKISFTATTADNLNKLFDAEDTDTASILINVRVQMDPEELYGLMKNTIQFVTEADNVKFTESNTKYFKPGYPKPLHRIGN